MISACVLISIIELYVSAFIKIFPASRGLFGQQGRKYKSRRPRAPMLCRTKIGIKSTLNQNDKHAGVIHNVNGGINILSYTLYDNSRNNTHIKNF